MGFRNYSVSADLMWPWRRAVGDFNSMVIKLAAGHRAVTVAHKLRWHGWPINNTEWRVAPREELRNIGWVYTEYRICDGAHWVTAAKASVVIFTNTCHKFISPIYVPPLSQTNTLMTQWKKNTQPIPHGIGKFFIIHQTKQIQRRRDNSPETCICRDFYFSNVIEMLLLNDRRIQWLGSPTTTPPPFPQM